MRNDGVAIIGGGPAGIAAAIQLCRYGLKTVVFEKNRIGGLLQSANLVENYPGFPLGISGPDLALAFAQQLQGVAAEVVFEEVIHLDHEGGEFTLTTPGKTFHPVVVLIASGTRPKRLPGVEIPPDCREAVCYDVSEILGERNRHIVIVGAGDAAFDYALNLSRSNRLTILNRGSEVTCLPLLRQRACGTGTISYRDHTRVVRVTSANSPGIGIECSRYDRLMQLQADYLIPAIGREPELGFLSTSSRDNLSQLVEEELIYFVGDVRNGNLRQTGIAVGDGIAAAMKIGAREDLS